MHINILRPAGWFIYICSLHIFASNVFSLDSQTVSYLTPGQIYREYSRTMGGQKDWRITDPNSKQPGAKEFLPNSILHIEIDDLDGAVRAEALFDRWGGHTGTIGQGYVGITGNKERFFIWINKVK